MIQGLKKYILKNILKKNKEQEKVEDNSWDEVAKILSNTKYRLPVSKNDTAVYVVDIPKAIEELKQHYTLTKKQ